MSYYYVHGSGIYIWDTENTELVALLLAKSLIAAMCFVAMHLIQLFQQIVGHKIEMVDVDGIKV